MAQRLISESTLHTAIDNAQLHTHTPHENHALSYWHFLKGNFFRKVNSQDSYMHTCTGDGS